MKSKRPTLLTSSLMVAVVALVSLIRCDSVPLTATTGSELSITANPTAIPAINGVSTITVTGFKSADDGGGTLPDGTQIFFTTNVGIIEERVEMQNGVARGFLRSNGRAGLAAVEARSGAGITVTLANPVLVGNAQGINILVTANPATVTPPDFTSRITATVFDNDNNALSDVPLVFSTTAGNLASESSILRTNQLGQAADRLTLENEPSATVTATSGTVTGSTTVSRGTVNNPIVSSVLPNSGDRDETLTVTINGLNFQPGAAVSFGDGVSVRSVNFVDSTTLQVTITIDGNASNGSRTVTVTNPDGGSGNLPSGFSVGSVPIVSSVFPSSGAPGDTLNVTITGLNFVPGATVSFGQGIAITSINFVSSTQLVVNITIDVDARIETQGRTVTVTNPDGSSDSLSDAFRVITPGPPGPQITSISPTVMATSDRGSAFAFTITGLFFQSGAQVGFDPAGISVSSIVVNAAGNQITMSLLVQTVANGGPAAGAFDVTVINPDGGTDTSIDAFTLQ